MNYIEIDKLKNIFSNFQRDQNTIRSIEYGINGKLIGIGYNPFWTNRYDSKIEKLELDFLNENGVMVPFVFKNIVDYNVYPKEVKRSKKNKINMIELLVLSPDLGQYLIQKREKDIYDKVQLEIIYND